MIEVHTIRAFSVVCERHGVTRTEQSVFESAEEALVRALRERALECGPRGASGCAIWRAIEIAEREAANSRTPVTRRFL
jgi:hypothetical protein